MSATGLDVFDKTLQTTHLWLNQIMDVTGPDKQVAWHVLGAVLRTLRDRVPLPVAVHLGAELPLLVRGIYYDQWHPAGKPGGERRAEEFVANVAAGLRSNRPVAPESAARAVFSTIGHHVSSGQVEKIRQSLPADIRRLWPEPTLTGARGEPERVA